MKFKRGDRVRRIGEPFNMAVVGIIYTVRSCTPHSSVTLEEIEGGYDPKYFELVPKLTIKLDEELFTL